MTIGIWPLNSATIEGKMGSSRQFILRLPDYNVDMKNHGFYNFSNSKEAGEGNAPVGSNRELHNDFDANVEDGNNVAIPIDDPSL